jgi:hypothetical protein
MKLGDIVIEAGIASGDGSLEGPHWLEEYGISKF